MFFDTAAALDPKAGKRRAKNYTRPLTRPGELAAARRRAGFVDVCEAVLNIRMEYASFADYWAPYLGKDGLGADAPAIQRSGICPSFHRLTLRVKCAIDPVRFSIGLVVHSVRYSTPVMPGACTVRVSTPRAGRLRHRDAWR
jgi:hypothetical protein